MKLGIAYNVFDGEELLEFAAKSIRNSIEYITVVYQTTSYFGNPADSNLVPLLNQLQKSGLIDKLIHYEPDLSLHHKENELRLRNLGLQASKKAGCTHHISSDVDEIYFPDQLQYAKEELDKEDFDFSMAPYICYYKKPTWQISPLQKLSVTFIHPVRNEYTKDSPFPFKIEPTRKLKTTGKYKIFTHDEIMIHHMCYVRKDLRKKYNNSDNNKYINLEEFAKKWETYKLGERLCLLPDYINRKTIEVPNYFGIIL